DLFHRRARAVITARPARDVDPLPTHQCREWPRPPGGVLPQWTPQRPRRSGPALAPARSQRELAQPKLSLRAVPQRLGCSHHRAVDDDLLLAGRFRGKVIADVGPRLARPNVEWCSHGVPPRSIVIPE